MKKYIKSGASLDTYKDYTIYYDGYYYIYTEPQGKGRVDFNNIEDAKEYIDNLMSTPYISTYRVDYTNSVHRVESIEVKAKNTEEAKEIAKSKLGRECKFINSTKRVSS